ncbi:hypothetical protein [Streptomyces sp. NPDC013171]|uniref:hypothetical protein n=1 Tax=Streptomyces sp. NPDC013171 TaxID=3364863 RepID=UPI0036A2928E
MKSPRLDTNALLSIAQTILGLLLAIAVGAVGVSAINDGFPEVWPAIGWFITQTVKLSSDDYVGTFVRDRILLFALLGAAFILWVTHKWPTLLKTVAQSFNPFARLGVATVSAIAAVLVALILAGPLGQSKSGGECTSSFQLSLNSEPSLESNTSCGKASRGENTGN